MATLSGNRPEAFLITASAYPMGLRLTWMNPTSSEDDHAYILQDSGVATLFVDTTMFCDRERTLAQHVPGLQRLMCFGANHGVGAARSSRGDAISGRQGRSCCRRSSGKHAVLDQRSSCRYRTTSTCSPRQCLFSSSARLI